MSQKIGKFQNGFNHEYSEQIVFFSVAAFGGFAWEPSNEGI